MRFKKSPQLPGALSVLSLSEIIKKMLGTSDAWLMRCSSQRATKPAYYIVDCQICSVMLQDMFVYSSKTFSDINGKFFIVNYS